MEFEDAVAGGEVDANADVKMISMAAIVQCGLLDAVARGATAGSFEDLRVGSVDLNFGDVGAIVRGGKGAEIGREERVGGLVVALAKEVGLADGFVGEWGVKSTERLDDEESSDGQC